MLTMRDSLQIVVSDVDDTLADVYEPASQTIIKGLNKMLEQGKKFFFISGQGERNICARIADHLDPKYRNQILLGGCSGAEVWGFSDGKLLDKPFYSLYEEKFTEEMKREWREILRGIIDDFGFQTIATMPRDQFERVSKGDPSIIMYEDRRAQITFEVVNGCNLNDEQYRYFKERVPYLLDNRDLRVSIIQHANEMFAEKNIPITARAAGTFAVDFAVKGVTKTTAIEAIMYHNKADSYWKSIPSKEDMPAMIEIWGDKFSVVNGGTDTHMCEAFPKTVRAIDFRAEPKEELPKEFNVVLWDGELHLCKGTEEYMKRSGLIR